MPRLGIMFNEAGKDVTVRYPEEHGVWTFDEDDYLLMALLQDPIYCAELLGEDPSNREYAGSYTVRDYQFPLFRAEDNYCGFTCARSVGKTESIKWRAVTHAFRRIRENLLLTAPELIHLLPLTDAVEAIINSVRLTREFLDTRNQKTGFTHRPFGVDFADGTKIVGRIPRLTGTGVKGQHQPDLIIDESQDYPDKGWVEVHETVLKDHVDQDGNPDFTYHFYGVHSGARDSGFFKRADGGAFRVVQVTAIQRPGWGRQEKEAAKAAYGGTSSPDYRRNILGEPGGAASPFFVTARLVACLDQDRDSRYNQLEIRPGQFIGDGGLHQLIRGEEFKDYGIPIADMLDLPAGLKNVYVGVDIGLTIAPTVIMIFNEEKVGSSKRLKLVRRIHMERMRTKEIRAALYAISDAYGTGLKGLGLDITGLGFPIWQEMEDDEACPPRLLEVATGYFFNSKVEVGVDKENIRTDGQGRMRDHLGATVEERRNDLTGEVMYVTWMSMIEASTRFLREMVDSTFLMLPFDTQITGDMQGETQQRVKRLAGLKQKPNAFHILDAMRAMAMKYREDAIQEQLAPAPQEAVYDVALWD